MKDHFLTGLERRKAVALGYALFILLAVVLAGTQPQLFHGIRGIPGGDKLGHFLLMGILSFLVNLALSAAPLRKNGSWVLKGTVIVAVLVTLEEFSQNFVAARTFSLLDLAADYAGILLFGELARRVHRRGVADTMAQEADGVDSTRVRP